MEDRFEHRDFEQFVKQSADQYRMFPSEKVWNNIHRTLHTRRRWYGIGLTLLLLTTAVVTWVMLLDPGTRNTELANINLSKTFQPTDLEQTEKPRVLIAKLNADTRQEPRHNNSSTRPTNHFFASANEDYSESISLTSAAEPVIAAITAAAITNNDIPVDTRPSNIKKSSPIQNTAIIARTSNISEPQLTTYTATADEVSLDADKAAEVKSPAASSSEIKDAGAPLYPMTIESVINTYSRKKGRKKLTWQIYAVPTISYRALKENQAFLREARSNGTIPLTQLPPDINSVVNHKPDLGFELGVSAGIPVSKNFKVIGGLQFNVSKYDIRAFNYQEEVATIALNSGPGANSVSTTSNYRSYGNTKANWLRNLYFSASAPIGMEIKFNSAKKSYAGFTTTLQPTYMLSNKSYLLSTDYKNYAEVPSLMRKWNLNTGFEVFAGYTTKKLEWRIGPQVRYQALSSFVDKYPVREHLFDFGLKVGVMLK